MGVFLCCQLAFIIIYLFVCFVAPHLSFLDFVLEGVIYVKGVPSGGVLIVGVGW